MDEQNAARAYDIDAEQYVLGCALLDAALVPKILSQVGPEDFSARHQPWMLAIAELFRADKPIDRATVLHELRTADQEANAARRVYAIDLVDRTPTTVNLSAHLELLKAAARMRKLWATAAAILSSPTEEGVGDLVESMVSTLSDHRTEDAESLSAGWDSFFERHASGVKPDYLHTSLRRLDERVHIGPGQLVILGGYPSDGKTALALQMALEMGKTKRVGFFSLETGNQLLMDRIAANRSGVSFEKIQANRLGDNEWAALAAAGSASAGLQLDRIHANGYSVADIRTRTKAKGYQVVMIDYLQLIGGANPKASRYDRVTQISMDLHNLAQQLGVTVLALSQLTRPSPGKDGKIPPPTMHSLRESGQIEQDADVVLLLSESQLTDREREAGAVIPEGAELRRLSVEKNKNGKRYGMFHLLLYGDTQRMEELHLPPKVPEPPKQESIPLPPPPESAFDVPARKR